MRRRRTRTTALALGLAAAALVGTATTAGAAPAQPGNLPRDVDALSRYEGATFCAAPQAGTIAFRNLLLATYGRQTIGTARACPANGKVNSEHMEGRALDWMLDAADPADQAQAQEFLRWLIGDPANAANATNARRLGVMYVIWDRKVWKAYQADAGWQPYTGPNPHTDHIHISLNRSGAAAETSWWTGTTDPITGHWIRLGGDRSVLGAPVSGARTLGRTATRRDYQGGAIFSSSAAGTKEVHGAIGQKYLRENLSASLGLPVTDEIRLPGGAFNHFEYGSVYFSPRGGTHVVKGAIRDAWARQGWETGRLGYPSSDEYDVPGGKRSDFVGGSVTFTWADGKIDVRLR
ncbi:LGFP repeat-containing protein [Kineococcus gynurae]|uniref:LGFP repeat-containing protein n=1 Tax=Kineococcus gynurae TaxID=452979 RepID=A0ABV5LRL5_9ACTN